MSRKWALATAPIRLRPACYTGRVTADRISRARAGDNDAFLATVAESLARQPWASAFGGVLHDVTLVRARDSWWARDRDGKALPLVGQHHWKAMALTGGHPSDLAGEWDGYGLRALGVFVAGRYWSL